MRGAPIIAVNRLAQEARIGDRRRLARSRLPRTVSTISLERWGGRSRCPMQSQRRRALLTAAGRYGRRVIHRPVDHVPGRAACHAIRDRTDRLKWRLPLGRRPVYRAPRIPSRRRW